jgi:hypothetical protein
MKLAVVLCLVATPAVALATPPADPSMTFFVTSKGASGSASLGGLTGADRRCQQLAVAAGAGRHTWRAYLSAAPDASGAAVDARDRIGRGPWTNARGVMIARDLDELHSDRSRLDRRTALDERGAEVPGDQHDVLTGSDDQGRLAFSDAGFPATCANWTSSGDGIARIGHADRFDAASWGNKRFTRWSGSWASEHFTTGCDAKRLADTGGSGRFYCFAADPAPPAPAPAPAPAPPPPAPPGGFSFRRGLNVNHWLGDNLPASMLPDSLYGAAWFDDEDVRWIAERGFDHLRIAVNGARWITASGDLDEAALAPFDRALAQAKARGMGIVLEMKGLPGYRSALRGEAIPDAASPYTDEATQGDAAYLWWLVARRYASEGDALRFELLGGPRAKEARDIVAFNRRCLAAIRRASPTRIVYLAPREPSPDLAVEVDLPDPYTALTFHFWEPDVFAFQADPTWPVVQFPGRVPDLSKFTKGTEARAGHADDEGARQFSRTELTVALLDARIDRLARRAHAVAGRREVYIGAWGVYQRADDDSARRYIRAVQTALERNGLSWAIYDYHSGCAVRDSAGKPTRVMEALRLPSRR